jgi:RNA polymerase sigma-70 factor (ECF subfamily)
MHRDEVVTFIAVRITDTASAEDAVQDLFLRLLSGRFLITPQTIHALVYTLARHAVADYFRRRRVSEEYEHYIKKSADGGQQAENNVESVFSARQLMERMERSLARLPKQCCDIYRLHIYAGMKVSEIAQELSLPYKQVENRLGQARRTVRQQLLACV